MKAGMAIEIDGLFVFPIELDGLAKNIGDHLTHLGLSCVHKRLTDNIVPSDFPLAPSALNNVVVLGRIVWKDKVCTATLSAAK